MRQTERDVKTGINSEIHASLRRLEDANIISEEVQARNLETLAEQVETKIGELQEEVYQLHTYIEPHIMDNDLQYFQTAWIGNLQVEDGGYLTGNFEIGSGGTLTVDGAIMANTGVDIYGEDGLFTPVIQMPSGGGVSNFTPHTLTINGRLLDGKILATKDLVL